MNGSTTPPARVLLVLGALALGAIHGCNDVGDDSAIPGGGQDAGGAALVIDGGAIPGDDAPANAGEDGGSVTSGSGAEDAGPSSDAASSEPANDDATIGPTDEDSGEVQLLDGGTDATAFDATVGVPDAGEGVDSGVDSGGIAGGQDAGTDAASPVVDAGGGGKDAGGSDAGGGGLVACTTPGQTGCVQCQYNNGAEGSLPNTTQTCTPTEAALVAHDIAKGLATAPGPDPDGSCYQCAANLGCLDDSAFGDANYECEDLSGASNVSECQATLACILSTSCAASEVSACYCGTAPVSGSCAAVGASNAANGACAATEAAGLGFSASDGLDILKSFTSTALPSGVANNIFQCALSNSCSACLQ